VDVAAAEAVDVAAVEAVDVTAAELRLVYPWLTSSWSSAFLTACSA